MEHKTIKLPGVMEVLEENRTNPDTEYGLCWDATVHAKAHVVQDARNKKKENNEKRQHDVSQNRTVLASKKEEAFE